MTTLQTAAQQALDDLKDLHANHNITLAGTISRLEAALAQEPGFWGRVAARQARRIKQMEAAAQQALEFIRAMNSHGWLLADYESDMKRTVAGLEAALAQEQAEPICKCDLRTRLVGDGCEACNPELAAESAQEQAEPVQEPVAWLTPGQDLHLNNPEGFRFSDWTPLYTAPPKLVPLTEEEIEACRQQGYDHDGLHSPFDFREAARAVERALEEKSRGR